MRRDGDRLILAFGDQDFGVGRVLYRMGAIRQPIVAQDDVQIAQVIASSHGYRPSRPSFLTTPCRGPCMARDTTHSCAPCPRRRNSSQPPFSSSPTQAHRSSPTGDRRRSRRSGNAHGLGGRRRHSSSACDSRDWRRRQRCNDSGPQTQVGSVLGPTKRASAISCNAVTDGIRGSGTPGAHAKFAANIPDVGRRRPRTDE